MAERRYVNNINLTAQTPVITINGANTSRTTMRRDRQNLANAIRDILIEQVSSGLPDHGAGVLKTEKRHPAAPRVSHWAFSIRRFPRYAASTLRRGPPAYP